MHTLTSRRPNASASRPARRQARSAGVAPWGGVVAAVLACAPTPHAPGTVVYASGADIETANPLVAIHPLARQLQRYALFVTLARLDSTLAPRPYLARRWDWSLDRRTLTLHLDPTLRWHDGAPTTAGDAAFTIEAARDPATGSPRAPELAAVAGAAAKDDSTLIVAFSAPQPALPIVLSELPIAPAHLLSTIPHADLRRARFGTTPVGNGPFRFARRNAGREWTFVRNDSFPGSLGGPPHVARLVVAVVDEPTTKFAGLVSGELDVAGIAPTAARRVAADPALRLVEYASLFSTALVFNTLRPPFDDARVRRAVSLAIDRERLVAAALGGYGIPSSSPVSPGHPFAATHGATHDPRAADSLLDAAGWVRSPDGRTRHGVRLAVALLTVGSGDNAVEQLVQSDLARRGMVVSIRPLELGAFLSEARAAHKEFDVLLAGVPGDLALAYLASMFDRAYRGGPLDYAGYHTATLDSLFSATRTATSVGGERAAWGAVQRELLRQAPAVWLYHARGVQGVSRRLGHVQMDLRGELASLASWTTEGGAAGGDPAP